MAKIERVEPYRASISRLALKKGNGKIRVWSEPRSAVDGAEVVDEVTRPLKVTVTEEQRETFSPRSQRVRIAYGRNKIGGWVLHGVLARRA
jgi:hypothetical protein